MKFQKFAGVIVAVALMTLGAVDRAVAQSATYSLNSTEVSAFSPGPYGSVTLTQSNSNVLVSVALNSGFNFVNTGSHSIFSFNLGRDSSASDITGITFANGLGGSFNGVSGTSNPSFSTFSYEINCSSKCANGGSGGGYVDPLNFTVTNAKVSEFGQLSTGHGTAAYFAADVINLHGDTGAIGATFAGTVSAVPEPDTYAMLLAGLGLIGFTARRRWLSK